MSRLPRLQKINPEFVLWASALWITCLPLLFWLGFEKSTYDAAMWPGAVILVLALYLLGKLHPLLFMLGALLTGLLNAIYAFIGHFFRIGDLSVRVETALDSSPTESAEFLQRFVLSSKFTWALMGYIVLGLILGGVYWALRRRSSSSLSLRTAAMYSVLLVFLGGLGWNAMTPYPAVRLGKTTYEVYTRVDRILERKNTVARIVAEQPTLSCRMVYDKIVFVLGESANRDFMHAYGYPLPTTPFLDQLEGKVLLRAISPANQTLSAVPVILTPATVQHFDLFYTSPSIVADLKRCGYQTFWLSNQLRYSPYTSNVSSIAREADSVRFVINDLKQYGAPDGILLELLSPDEIRPGQPQAFFFHLLGSHFEWKKRYPPDQALLPNPRNLPETYINTIYYTDQVLQEIFQLFRERSEDLLFIYVSDHGEWIMETTGGHASAHPFQEEYRIPLVFWSTRPEDLAPIAEAAGERLVNTETLDQQIRFLLGLRPDPGLSFSTEVLVLGPGTTADYFDLPALGAQEKP